MLVVGKLEAWDLAAGLGVVLVGDETDAGGRCAQGEAEDAIAGVDAGDEVTRFAPVEIVGEVVADDDLEDGVAEFYIAFGLM